jgi:hypothetical protein
MFKTFKQFAQYTENTFFHGNNESDQGYPTIDSYIDAIIDTLYA